MRPNGAAAMKLASSSISFDPAIAGGELTQLEWLDLCATELALDGIVFEARHFPRTDPDYIAQLKKMSTDLGLTVAGVACDAILAPQEGDDDALASAWFEVAWGLGAPLVVSRAPAGVEDPQAWSALVAAGRLVAGAAKRRNVTLAVRNAPGTLCAAPADLKQLAKEVDGSWLRFAVDVGAFEPAEPPDAVMPKAVVAAHVLSAESADDAPRLRAVIDALGTFRAFLVIDALAEPAGAERLAAAIATAHDALARQTRSPASS
jgi:sugar phosphate isomerase/epimerase